MIPDNKELQLRISKIIPELRKTGAKAALISSLANIFYTSGRIFRGYVYIDVERETAIRFIIKPSGIGMEGYTDIRKPEQIPGLLAEVGITLPDTLGLELDTLTYSEAMRLQKAFGECGNIVNCSGALAAARMVKTPFEIEEMRADGKHQANVYNQISNLYSEGMTDLDLQIAIESVLRHEGCLGYYRTNGNSMELNLGTVLAGDNADNPTPYDLAVGGGGIHPSLPAGANGSELRSGITVSVDMNGSFNGYQTDMTRVWRIGDVSENAMKAHETSRAILRRLEKDAKPGVSAASLYETARQMAEEAGLADNFMGHNHKAAFVGHGVGIELNEQPVLTPRSKAILAEGMTIAIEPKFVIPGVGAVGVENTYVVRAEGLECLTPCPEEMQIL